MKHNLYRQYSIGSAPWNCLTKDDYQAIADNLISICSLEHQSRPVKVDFDVRYENGGSSTFTQDEFNKHFSISSAYSSIQMHCYNPLGLSAICSISPYELSRSISLSSECLTFPEIEDRFLHFQHQLEQIYKDKSSPPPAVVHEIISTKDDENERKPNETHSTESDDGTAKKSLFWTRLGVIVAIVFGVLAVLNPPILPAIQRLLGK